MVFIRRRKGTKGGILLAAFALGLMLAFFVPLKWLVVILAAAVIILGLLCTKFYC